MSGTARGMLGILVLGVVGAAAGQAGWSPGLVVHEWGTFTSVASADGQTLGWNPWVGPQDLPGFVNVRMLKTAAPGTVRMETPVLYFYGDGPLRVSAEVRFPAGTLTEWYPAARPSERGSRLAWTDVAVLPGADAVLPREERPSHYYAARETDAALLRVGKQHERFLFYRGVGTFELPLSARLDGGRVHLRAAAGAEPGIVVLFESRGGRTGHAWDELRGGEAVLDRPVLGQDAEDGLAIVAEQLRRSGLYPREVDAMLATWRDAWTEEGCRVFYVLPRAAVDGILPLTVRPQPAELVRVMVGRLELLTPERAADVRARQGRGGPEPDRFAPLMRR
jgi:hypothetical protein